MGLPDGPWLEEDRLLAMALTHHEDSLHSCGHPMDRTFDPRSEGEFEAHDAICQACAARQRKEHELGRDRKDGQQVWVEDVGPG